MLDKEKHAKLLSVLKWYFPAKFRRYEMCMRLRCDHALAVIRIMLGLIFIAHGSQKVFGLFGGPGLAGFATWLGTYGLPPVLAYLAAFAEFIGGALLVTGYFAKLGGLMTSAVMLGAIFIIHWPKFFAQNGGFEYPLVLLITTLAVVCATRCSVQGYCDDTIEECGPRDTCCK